MEIIKTNLPKAQRRIALLETADAFSKRMNRKIAENVIFSTINPPLFVVGNSIIDNLFSEKDTNFIYGDIDFFSKNYDFPPQHPIRGAVYACHDFNPNLYIPITNFHEKALELKMNDFFDLCESLGAKKCTLVYEEENDKVLKSNLDFNGPTPYGEFSTDNSFNTNRNRTTTLDGQVNFTKPTNLTDLDSPWLNSEPTWKAMKNSRLRGGRGNTRVEFNYKDSMGVDGKLAINLEKAGFNLGGSFTEMKKVKHIYDVEFWEI